VFGGVLHGEDLHPAPQFALGVAGQGGAQQPFEVRLVEEGGLREAVVAVRIVAPELGHDPVPGVQQPQAVGGSGEGRELLVDARRLEDPAHLVVHGDGARQRVDVPVAFQENAAHAPAGEQDRGGDADRARPHDDHRGDVRRVARGGLIRVHARLTSRSVRLGRRKVDEIISVDLMSRQRMCGDP
jgi:hypothetical protein